MPPPPERRWPGIAAGYAVLAGLLLVAGAPAYWAVAPPTRPLVVRLAVAVLLGVALLHLGREVRARLQADAPSPFERAGRPRRAEPELAPRCRTLRDQLAVSRASQGYFAHVLWPRLLALAERAGAPPLEEPPRPAWRRALGRGPSLAALGALVARLERRA
jgi:hypothetical protein